MNKKKNDGLSDFMKFVNKHGGVKDVSEAFKEFPVEEEWHKGKVENVLSNDGLKEYNKKNENKNKKKA